jgi:LacI family transcriptional regulator
MTERPTLREVARLSGYSIKTISRVVNGNPNVSQATSDRVLHAIAELGYRPNLVARSLRVGRDDAIGLVVPSIADPFFAEVASAIEEASRERGFFVIVSCTGEEEGAEEAVVAALLTRQVAGLILVPTAASQAHLGRRNLSMPIVCLDRPAVDYDCDAVLADNEMGALAATNLLLANGHRRIAFVGGPTSAFTTRYRCAGYKRAHKEAGIAVDPEIVHVSAILPGEAAEIMPHLLSLSDPVTALVTSNVKATLGAVAALHRLGRPDIAMVAFDDFPLAEAMMPPVTVALGSPTEIGRRAAELVFRRLAGDTDDIGELVLPIVLIKRGSEQLRPAAAARPS